MKKSLVLFLMLPVVLASQPAHAVKLAKGLHLHNITWRGNHYHYVVVNLNDRHVTTNPASSSYPITRVPPIGHGLASIGADFFCSPKAPLPCHLYVKDKEIWSTGVGRGGVSYTRAGSTSDIQPAVWQVFLRSALYHPRRINHINWTNTGINAYTPRGGSLERPVGGYCYVRIIRKSAWLDTDADGWQRVYTVKMNRCGATAPSVDPGEIIIQSPTQLPYKPGEEVTWVENLALPHATDVISGMTDLVEGGINVAPTSTGGPGDIGHDGYYYDPCPRAALGVSADGHTTYMVIVDGLPGNAEGVRLPRLASFFIRVLHADSAVNLDGGGSAMLWTKRFGVVSKPSYGYVRPTIYATLVN